MLTPACSEIKVCWQEVGAISRGQGRSYHPGNCQGFKSGTRWEYLCVTISVFIKLKALIASHGTRHKILIKSLWQWPWIMNDISPSHRRSASDQNKWHFYPPRARPNESNWDVNPSLSSARHPQRIRGKENRLIEAFARTKHDSTDLLTFSVDPSYQECVNSSSLSGMHTGHGCGLHVPTCHRSLTLIIKHG